MQRFTIITHLPGRDDPDPRISQFEGIAKGAACKQAITLHRQALITEGVRGAQRIDIKVALTKTVELHTPTTAGDLPDGPIARPAWLDA